MDIQEPLKWRTSDDEGVQSGQRWQNNQRNDEVIYIHLSAGALQQKNRGCTGPKKHKSLHFAEKTQGN